MKGECLCGAVSFEAPNAGKDVEVCHCTMCRQWGGTASLSLSCGAEVRFDGVENMTVYPSSDWAERAFCKVCGTHLFYRYKATGGHEMPAGLFEDQDGLRMSKQIFIDHKPGYYSFADDTPKLTRAETLAQFGVED